ncbi:hypothetical protein C0583_04790 [Candidatus Parcubacteria bacterium]|nr:MAG: hypothetical protein C0583_04790 [Candidatus Parcubacteria bacterium]
MPTKFETIEKSRKEADLSELPSVRHVQEKEKKHIEEKLMSWREKTDFNKARLQEKSINELINIKKDVKKDLRKIQKDWERNAPKNVQETITEIEKNSTKEEAESFKQLFLNMRKEVIAEAERVLDEKAEQKRNEEQKKEEENKVQSLEQKINDNESKSDNSELEELEDILDYPGNNQLIQNAKESEPEEISDEEIDRLAEEAYDLEIDQDEYYNEEDKEKLSGSWKEFREWFVEEHIKDSFSFNMLSLAGYGASWLRSKSMGSIMRGAAKVSKKHKMTHDFFKEFENLYKEDSEEIKEMIKSDNMTGYQKLGGVAQGFGHIARLSRVLYDATSYGAGMAVNPFRHVTLVAMGLGRGSEAFKRSIYNRDDRVEKTRIEDPLEAMDYDEKIFNIDLKKKSTDNLYSEDLEKLYQKNIPKDLLDRLDKAKEVDVMTSFIQRLFMNRIESKVGKIVNKIEKIQNSDKDKEKKEKKIENVYHKYRKLLKDLDKIVSYAGQVDTLSYSARIAETSFKTTANLLILDSVLKLANASHLYEIFERAWEKGDANVEGYEDIEKVASHSMATSVEISRDQELNNSESLSISKDGPEDPQVAQGLRQGIEEELPSEQEYVDDEIDSQEQSLIKKLGNAEGPDQEFSKIDTPSSEAPATEAPTTISEQDILNEEKFEEQLRLATIHAGAGSNSVEGVIIKQLVDDPKEFGFNGDLNDQTEIKRWAGSQAHRIAIDNKYFDPQTGQGVRLKASSIDTNAYIIKNEGGRIVVQEYVNGELRENASELNTNEYLHQNKPTESNIRAGSLENQSKATEKYFLDEVTKHSLERYGFDDEALEKIDIDTSEALDEKSIEKINFVISHNYDTDKSIEIINNAQVFNLDLASSEDYYTQLHAFEGNSRAQQGVIEILENKNYKDGLQMLFGTEAGDLFRYGEGEYGLKEIAPGYDMVLKNDGGILSFGLDGPFGKNYTRGGWTLLFDPNIELNQENLNKVMEVVRNLREKK